MRAITLRSSGATAVSAFRRASLRMRWSINDDDYSMFGFDKRPLSEAVDYVSWTSCSSYMLPRLNDRPSAERMEDKLVFHASMVGRGLPVPELLAVHCAGEPLTDIPELLAFHGGAVLKPALGRKGEGVVVVDSVNGNEVAAISGERMRLSEALERSRMGGHDGRVLVQQRLRQHRDLNRYAPQPTSTVRVFTLLPESGQGIVVGAFLRLGRAGAMTDNVSQGGVAVRVHTDTGILGDGIIVSDRPLQRMQSHPDSRTQFSGSMLPYWPEVMELCHKAASVFTDVRFIGWDIMVTDGGPCLIEANSNVRLSTLQALQGGVLGTDVRDELRSLNVQFSAHLPGLVPAVSRRLWGKAAAHRAWRREAS